MKLVRLVLENFRGAPNGTWSFMGLGGAPLDTVFITGPASSGKTTFLEAIAALKESVGAYDMPPETKRLRRRGATSGKVEGTWQLSADEMRRAELDRSTVTTTLDLGNDGPAELAEPGLRELFAAYSHDSSRGKFEYFPANRAVGSGEVRASLMVDEEARLRLGKGAEKYATSKRALINLALGDGVTAIEEAMARGLLLRNDQRDSLAPYRKDLAGLAPHLRLIGVEIVGKGHELIFERADGARLTLDDLSDSEKQAFLFCATFRRIGLSHSVVLVDQPELYLHADLHLRFIQALGRLGVDNQIFYATGSLDITRTAMPNQVIQLEAFGRTT